MIGTLEKIVREMKNGVYDFTDNGKCTSCGQCCSAILPLSRKEIRDIERYVRKHNIQPCDHTHGIPTSDRPLFDLVCPFRDNTKRICTIYNCGIKPYICESFRCDKPLKQEMDKELYRQKRIPINMWGFFKDYDTENEFNRTQIRAIDRH